MQPASSHLPLREDNSFFAAEIVSFKYRCHAMPYKIILAARVTHLLADWVGLTWVWDVPLSCLGSTAAAVQPNANSLWNIQNPSQRNPGPRGDGSPCRLEFFRSPGDAKSRVAIKCMHLANEEEEALVAVGQDESPRQKWTCRTLYLQFRAFQTDSQ